MKAKIGTMKWFIKEVYNAEKPGSLMEMMQIRALMELRRIRLLLVFLFLLSLAVIVLRSI